MKSRIGLLLLLVLSLSTVTPSWAEDGESRCLVTAPGECVQVTISGEGPDVLLIPGLFGSAFAFRRVTAGLTREGYRTIVVEPLGVGDSSRPKKADYTLTAQADRIEAAMDTLDLKNAVLVSHAIGSSIALRLAYRHPGRVRALVSIEGGVAEEAATPGFRRAMRFAPLIKLFGAGRIIRGKVREMLVERSGNPDWVTEEIVRGYSAGPTRDTGATLDTFSQMSKAREPEPLAPRLPELKFPVRLLLGGAPHVGAPSEAEIRLLERSLPSFRITRVPGSGHFIFEEAPSAVVAAVIEIAALKAPCEPEQEASVPRGGSIPVPRAGLSPNLKRVGGRPLERQETQNGGLSPRVVDVGR